MLTSIFCYFDWTNCHTQHFVWKLIFSCIFSMICLYTLQSPTLSGVSWYKLSSVEIGLLVSLNSIIGCFFFGHGYIVLLSFLWLDTFVHNWNYSIYILILNIIWGNGIYCLLQTSGSLYGALIGSVLAFNVADFLGNFPFCQL